MNEKILYLDCSSGISGDMTVAALLDLGADENVLRRALSSLPLDGYRIEITRVTKSAIDACDFHVILDEEHENHDHDMAYLHGEGAARIHENSEVHSHEEHEPLHGHEHHHEEHEPLHRHEHEHPYEEHGHNHDHGGSSHHHGRSLPEIQKILEGSGLTPGALALALKIFRIVAEAESKVHNKPLDQVHFHEVGAVDSIVDIASAAVCIDNLGITRTVIPVLNEGRGQIMCQHGLLPIPVPATTAISAAYHLPLHITDVQGELVTPTGAAIAAALMTSRRLPDQFRIEKVGIGAGKRDYKCAGILRAMLITPEEETAADPDHTPSRVLVMECSLDDCTGEALGFVMDELFAAGALDVFFVPIHMKKNRPGTLLTVIARPEERTKMEQIIFCHTTTLGIRWRLSDRTKLDRAKAEIDTPWGKADVKYSSFHGEIRCSPESDSVAALARRTGESYTELYNKIKTLGSRQ